MRILFALLTLFLVLPEKVLAVPPIEAYGALPNVKSVALSPDGKHVAFLTYRDNLEALVIYNLAEGPVVAINIEKIKARRVRFAGPNYVILNASSTRSIYGYRGRLEYTAAFAFSIKDRKLKRLPERDTDLYPAQEGIGKIVGVSEDGKSVFMPAFTGIASDPPYDLLRVKLSNGSARPLRRGRNSTIDWFTTSDTSVVVREYYRNASDKYEIDVNNGDGFRTIFETTSPRIPLSLVGMKPDNSAMILVDETRDLDYSTAHELSFDGNISSPVLNKKGLEIQSVVTDINRIVHGVEYAGMFPNYAFYDSELQHVVDGLQNYFGGAVSLVSWTEDFSKVLVYVEGVDTAGSYYTYKASDGALEKIADARPGIAQADIAEVQVIEYSARDGLKIPALLTLPKGRDPKMAPLIVLPHGGPESHDTFGFDWMAQFFASRGYLVLQPNFRGSDGFGVSFRNAGRGEWGGKMQDDITDGVTALINSGRADPDRVCIVGGSYGGYAALAGGAFTPDLYKCVAAIAPVSDIPRMLRDEKRDYGRNHWVVDYWRNLVGHEKGQDEHIASISPINHAEAFQAPVLLIHGKDDLVVPMTQSETMERELKKAGKDVELIKLKGEDHWLSSSETRLSTLAALEAFVNEHIGDAE